MNSKIYTVLIFLLIFIVNAVSQEASDSLSYITLRDSLIQKNYSDPIFLTTDALAEAGLYSEALELLNNNFKDGLNQKNSPKKQTKNQWRISSGIDYYHHEDVDTATMTPEERKDYKRLTEAPLSVWVRTKSTIKPVHPHIEEITPEIYISERKSKIETSALFSSLNGFLQYEPSVKVEKWFQSDASGQSPFKPASKQPSDMGGLSLRTKINSIAENKNLNWFVPLCIDWEHYRSDRPGYESFVEYSLFPSIGLKNKTVNSNLGILMEYEDYYNTDCDSLDVLRFTVRADASVRASKMFSFFNLIWIGDRYTKSSSIKSINRFEGVYRGNYNVNESFRTNISLRGIYENELDKSFPDSVNSRLNGKEMSLCSGIELIINKKVHFGPEFQWEYRWAEKNGGYFLWEQRNVMEPGLRIRWGSELSDVSVKCSFRYEDIEENFEIYRSDNRSICLSSEASIAPLSFLVLNLYADYQYRKYAPFGIYGRITENLAVSGSLMIKL